MKPQQRNKFLEIYHGRSRIPANHNDPSKEQTIHDKQTAQLSFKEPAARRPHKRTLVAVPLGQLEYHVSVYEWRAKTTHPLLFSTCIGVQFKRLQRFIRKRDHIITEMAKCSLPADHILTLQVETEHSQALHHYLPLPFSQHLYALKEALYGFEQLHTLFRTCRLDPAALRVTSERKLKVWHSLPLDSNPLPSKQNLQQSEHQLLRQIVHFFEGYKLNSSVFRQFYEGLEHGLTFLRVIRHIDNFIERHKIKIDKRITASSKGKIGRALSPRNQPQRVPKFLSPSALPVQHINASARISAQNSHLKRRQQHSQSPSKPENSLKKTSSTKADHRVNLVRTEKQRKGSGNNFCFTSLHRLEATHKNLKSQSKASQICFGSGQLNGQSDTMVSLNAENSLLKKFDKLFEEQSQIDYLSVSINLEEQTMPNKTPKQKKLSNYGRVVSESIINSLQVLKRS